MEAVAIVLGIASLLGTLVGAWSNKANNDFIDSTNRDNREFQEQTNLQNHEWSKEAAEWEYQHSKPQQQYADLLSAGLTPAAAAQKISGASVGFSPATAVAPQNAPKSTNMLNDSLQKVFSDIGNYSSMAQAQASAEKTMAETKVINETSIKKANAEIDKILMDTLKSYSDIGVNNSQTDLNISQTDLNEANTDLATEKATTEQVNRQSIQLSNEEKSIQLDFTRKTLEMSLNKTEAEIKLLSEQTAKLQEDIKGADFENKFKEWRNTYIETYGVAPEQGWQDMLFKAMADGKGNALLDSLSQSLRLIFSEENGNFDPNEFNDRGYNKYGYNKKGQYNIDEDWYITRGEQRNIKRMKLFAPGQFDSLGNTYYRSFF